MKLKKHPFNGSQKTSDVRPSHVDAISNFEVFQLHEKNIGESSQKQGLKGKNGNIS